MIWDSQRCFELPWPNSFFIMNIHDNREKKKSMDLSMDLCHSNNMKVVLCKFAEGHCFWTLWTLDYIDCIPFSGIDSFHMAHNQAKII